MIIKIITEYDSDLDASAIANFLSKRVSIVSKDDNQIVFQTRGLLNYFIIGRLFTIIDYGEIQIDTKKKITSYKVVSIRFWLLLAFIFIISGILPNNYLLGILITCLFGIGSFLTLYLRHKLYFKQLVTKN